MQQQLHIEEQWKTTNAAAAEPFGIMDDTLISTMSTMVKEHGVCILHEMPPDPERVRAWLTSFEKFANHELEAVPGEWKVLAQFAIPYGARPPRMCE